MKKRFKGFIPTLLTSLIASSLLYGQGNRWQIVGQGDIEAGSHSGFMTPESDSKISFTWVNATSHEATIQLGFTKLLASETVSSSLLPNGRHDGPFDRFLFAGEVAGGKGGLVLVGFANGTYKILAQKTYPGRSFTGVGYSIPHKKIYLLDQTNKVILRGVFDPAQNSLPNTLTVAVTASQCSGLNQASKSTLFVGNETEADPGIVLGEFPSPSNWTFWTIWDKASGPVVSEHMGDLDYPHFGIDGGLLLDGQVQVRVEGKPGEGFEVVSTVTGTVFGSGQIGANGVTMANVSPLSMGDFYGVKAAIDGKVRGKFMTPVKVWGSPETLSSGFKMQDLPATCGLLAEIGGNTDMAPSFGMDVPANPPAVDQQWQAWLLVGTEQDVVPAGGGKYVIVSNLSIPGFVYWGPSDGQAVGNIAMQTPTDPNLAGTVVTYQWMIQEGSNLYFSDVLGVMLRGDIWDPSTANQNQASSSGGGGSSAKSSSKTKKKLRPQARRKLDATVRASLGKWMIMNGVKPLPSKIFTKLKARTRKK